jgi:hypothetical protein
MRLAETVKGVASRVYNQFTGKGGDNYAKSPARNGKNGITTDPDKLDSEEPDDKDQSYFPDEYEEALARMIKQRVKSSGEQRKEHEWRYKENLQFYLGDQWCEVGANGYRSLKNAGDLNRVYADRNKIRPICRKHIARLLGTQVDVSIAPLTGRPADVAAAKQARSLHAHFQQAQNDAATDLQAAEEGTIIGLVWAYDYWDDNAVAPVPHYNEQTGEIEDVTYERVGDACCEMLSFTDVYVDPRCRNSDLSDAQWVIIACQRSLPYVREKYPRAEMVTGDTDEHSSLRLDIDHITGNHNQDEVSKKVVTLYTLWEQPTERHKRGLYAVCTDSVCLVKPQPWPYEEMRDPKNPARFEFPVTPFSYDRGIESFWGDGVTTQLKSPQRSRNRYVSKADMHTRNGDGKILMARGMEIAPDSFVSGKPNEIIPYTPLPENSNLEPKHWPNPPLDPAIGLNIQLVDQDMADIGEVQSVDMGRAPSGTPGVVVNALLDASQSGIIIAQKSWEYYKEARARKRLAIVKPKYTVDRMIYAQDTAPESIFRKSMQEDFDPSEIGEQEPTPKMQAMAFQDLAEGRYSVKATSQPPRSPSARAATLMQLYQSGAFLPQNLPATILVLEAMELTQGEKWVSDLLYVVKRQEEQARQAQEAEQAHQAAMMEAKEQEARQRQAELLNVQQGMKQAELQAEQQKTAATLQAQAMMGAAESEARGATQMEVEKQRNEAKLQQQVVGAMLTPPPTSSSGKDGKKSKGR